MSFLKAEAFNKKYVTRPISRIVSSPKEILPDNLVLPEHAVIHFKADSDNTLGISSNHDLIRVAHGRVYNYNVPELKAVMGHVTKVNISMAPLIKKYYQSHLAMKPIKDIERVAYTTIAPIVMNYSMLPQLYKYQSNTLIVYQEWYNIHQTMWKHIKHIGVNKEHFLIYKLPDVLPSKNELIKYTHDFKPTALIEFQDENALNILELWRILSDEYLTTHFEVSKELVNSITLVFIESGHLVLLKLKDLVEWSYDDKNQAQLGFYKFLDHLISFRNSLKSETIIKEAEVLPNIDEISNDKIFELIKEKGAIGLLSAPEQAALIKLANKHKTIVDPITGNTLDKMNVTNEELILKKEPIASDKATIHDKSMLFSSIQQLQRQYTDGILHKDIVNAVMMLHPAGVIVKDIKVKRKLTVSTKADLYSFQLQPINGPSSTISFTIPVIESDGTFMANGVRYRMDMQKGD